MRRLKSQKGIALLEVLICLVILSILAVGMLSALAAASKVLLQTNVRETAKNLAETQLEYIKNAEYDPVATSYNTSSIVITPSYFVATNVVHHGSDINFFNPVRDDNIQKIVVTITGAGITYNLEGFKTR